LKDVKKGCYSLDEARALMNVTIKSMAEDKQQYMEAVPAIINEHADEVLKTATVEILKRSFLNEIQRGDQVANVLHDGWPAR
jgi:hypothetical protein